MPDILNLIMSNILNEQSQYTNSFDKSLFNTLKEIIDNKNITTTQRNNITTTTFKINNKEELTSNSKHNKIIILFLKKKLKTLLDKRYKLKTNNYININNINIEINNMSIDFNKCSVTLSDHQLELIRNTLNIIPPELIPLYNSRTSTQEQSEPDYVNYNNKKAIFSIKSINGVITIKQTTNNNNQTSCTLMNNTKNNKLEITIS